MDFDTYCLSYFNDVFFNHYLIIIDVITGSCDLFFVLSNKVSGVSTFPFSSFHFSMHLSTVCALDDTTSKVLFI